MKRFFWFVLPFLGVAAASCATATTLEGTGGDDSASSATTSSPASNAASSSTGAGGCTVAADCAGMNDACNQGTCVNGACTKVPANDFGACDDGLFCTESDTCTGGACVGGAPHICNGNDPCKAGACDEAKKMCDFAPANDGASCPALDLCHTGVCAAGSCVDGAPIDCSFFTDQCGTGACDPIKGCFKQALADGTPCNDGFFCTISDRCMAGTCGGDPNNCAPPGNPCFVGVCDENAQTCVAMPGNDGLACDDQNPCTSGETCSAGVCGGGVPGNDGSPCDDQNGCTTGTTCLAGICGNAVSTITSCTNGDGCCPNNCPTDTDCTPIHYGHDVQFASASSHAPNYLLGSQLVVPKAGTLKALSLISMQAGPHVVMALYTDLGGTPNQLVASTPSTVLGVGTLEIPVNPTMLPAGNYWIMAVYDVSASVGIDFNNNDQVDYISFVFGSPLPAVYPAPQIYNGQAFNYYIVVQ